MCNLFFIKNIQIIHKVMIFVLNKLQSNILSASIGISDIIRDATNTRIVRTDKTPGVEILVLLVKLD